ncbi:MAG: FAD-dependent oxidoreductase [Alphaproteobacteria bacterium]|jgi:hypothetical protein|nr:FAD-dependent oxidoreductase [Alphaproteobacteria bacterium]MBT5389681.1 FAD-dependent oxidoreductase [Alphaproteobacteria bacterium]MBT5540833.1 FAD-dependent oxidoreductase [Alphaproteobacteria bacterium]MBT5654848.1 FAD-dependent oxidoreductase [Alphaproteobacteria bacterium]
MCAGDPEDQEGELTHKRKANEQHTLFQLVKSQDDDLEIDEEKGSKKSRYKKSKLNSSHPILVGGAKPGSSIPIISSHSQIFQQELVEAVEKDPEQNPFHLFALNLHHAGGLYTEEQLLNGILSTPPNAEEESENPHPFHLTVGSLEDLSASLEFPHDSPPIRREKVGFAGGGLTAIFTAILASQYYDVTILEKMAHLLDWASKSPGRLHLGGEYPEDPTTALQCLQSALLFRIMLKNGPNIFTSIPATAFLVPKASGEPLLEQSKRSYAQLQEAYKLYHSRLVETFGTDIGDMLFGPPEDFFKEIGLDPRFPDFLGGILTHEQGLNPGLLGALLETILEEKGVKVLSNHPVTAIKKVDDKFQVRSELETYEFDYFVNATWEGVFWLNSQVKASVSNSPSSTLPVPTSSTTHPKQGGNSAKLFQRGMAVMKISKGQIPKFDGIEAALFGLGGKEGGMWSPFNPKIALGYHPGTAYMGEQRISTNRKFPRPEVKLNEQAEHEKRLRDTVAALNQRYPTCESEGFDLMVRPTLSINSDVIQRQHCDPEEIVPGFISAISPKATFVPFTALQILKLLVKNSQRTNLDFSISHSTQTYLNSLPSDSQNREADLAWLFLPEELRFPPTFQNVDFFLDRARGFLLERGLPIQIVDRTEDTDNYNDSVRVVCQGSYPRLNLSDQDLGDTGVQIVAQNLPGSNIHELWLRNTNIWNEGLISLSNVLKASPVEVLDISGSDNHFGDEGIKALGNTLATNTTLNTLYMRDSKITDPAMFEFAKSIAHSKLRKIDLSGSGITDYQLGLLLSALETNTTLEEIILDNNPISDRGCAHIGRFLKSNKLLRVLSLRRSTISEKGFHDFVVTGLKYNTTLMEMALHQEQTPVLFRGFHILQEHPFWKNREESWLPEMKDSQSQ